MVPEKVSLKAEIVVGGVSWSILIDAGRVGITIVFPVTQPAATIVNKKLDTDVGTERKSGSEHVIVTMDVPATSDVYRV